MKKILIYDSTIKELESNANISFRDKLDTIKQLDKMKVYAIQMPAAVNTYNCMLISSIAPSIKNSKLMIDVNLNTKSIDEAVNSLKDNKNAILNICVPTSSTLMEYDTGIKEKNIAEKLKNTILYAKDKNADIQVCLQDISRANANLLNDIIKQVNDAKIKNICIEESQGKLQNDEFINCIETITKQLKNSSSLNLSIKCSDNYGFSLSNALWALNNNFVGVITSVSGNCSTNIFNLLKAVNEIDTVKLDASIKHDQFKAEMQKIDWVRIYDSKSQNNKRNAIIKENTGQEITNIDENSDKETVLKAIKDLGYIVEDYDSDKIYNEVVRIAQKKEITIKEIDAIIATSAAQVPSTYKLVEFVINTSNLFPSMAYITLEINGVKTSGQSTGTGPIGAAIMAIEDIVQTHYELEDFQLKNLTKSSDSVGMAIFKLRNKGHVCSGQGVSTDIVSASIRAYLNALNQLVYAQQK